MLPDTAIIEVTAIVEGVTTVIPLPKRFILDAVWTLYHEEQKQSINPDILINKGLAEELIAQCLKPR